MKKKIITILLVCVIGAGAITGTILGIKQYQKNKLVADVQSVSMMNWGFSNNVMESEGMVTNDASQDIYLEAQQVIKDVFVSEGQEVKTGDPLLEYDLTSLELSIEVKKLEIQTIADKTTITTKELERLKKITPVSPVEETPKEEEPLQPEPFTLPSQQKIQDAYNYISTDSVPYNQNQKDETLGSMQNPYRYLCTEDGFVTGEFLSAIGNGEVPSIETKQETPWVVLEIREGNQTEGELINSWLISSQTAVQCEADSRWSVAAHSIIEQEQPEEPVAEPEPTEQPQQEENTYTAEQLAKLISDKEMELKKLDLDKRKAQLALSNLEEDANDGVVYAKVNGVVKTVQDKDHPSNDGSAFLTVTGSEGLYVKGCISELMLDQIQIGQQVNAMSWQSGLTFQAQITEIDSYPDPNPTYYGEGNPNVSYYDYTAYIENPEGITSGEYLSLTIDMGQEDVSMASIYLDAAYVREEDGKYYVMKDDAGKLKKQYVKTGKMLYGGQAIEIQSGLSEEDNIAFPYGKTAQEGVKTRILENY